MLANLLTVKDMEVSLRVQEQDVLDRISYEGINMVFHAGLRLIPGHG